MAELSKLGRYQLRRVLGKGAMGVVYDGFDPTINRRVAVKTILKSHAIDEEMARDYSVRFVREAQAAGRINHPNIVQVYDFGEQEDIAYLVMEFIEGRELRSLFSAKERFEVRESVRIMGELLDALDFAHAAGVIHRDVKPANVMLDAQRRVKLADFGVARIQDSERSAIDTMVGTPAYMSPEQISGKKIDRRTDIFSAGSILYQLLTGEQPFKGEGAWTVARQIMQDDPPLPSRLIVSVSPVFDEIVNKALAKDPAQRFATAGEFANTLRGVLFGKSPSAQQTNVTVPKRAPRTEPRASDAEVEFWRSIQNSSDPSEFDVYLQEFPDGTYAQLAKIKIAKLREQAEPARKEAEEKSRQEAEAKARREAEANAEREALAKAKREAEERALREALEKTKREAAEKARREADEKARQAQALARLRQQEEAAARAKPAVDEDATVAIDSGRPAAESPSPPQARRSSYAMPAVVVAVLIAGGAGAYLLLGRKPAPAPAGEIPAAPKAEAPAPAKTEITPAEIEKIRRETEERVRREFADKSSAEQAAMAKAAAAKAVHERQNSLKTAAERAAAAEKAAAERAGAEQAAVVRAAADKAAAEKAAAERTAAEKAVVEKAVTERLAVERAAMEKAISERLAAERAAADRAAAEKAAAAAKSGGWNPNELKNRGR